MGKKTSIELEKEKNLVERRALFEVAVYVRAYTRVGRSKGMQSVIDSCHGDNVARVPLKAGCGAFQVARSWGVPKAARGVGWWTLWTVDAVDASGARRGDHMR